MKEIMKLYDIGENERIQIVAENKNASLQYLTTVVMNKQKLLLIHPIMYGDRIVNFDVRNVRTSVVYTGEGDKPLVWDDCVIKNTVYQQQKYQVVYSAKEGKRINRREAYRQYVGTKGILQVDSTRDKREVVVKDISTSGIAFVSDLSMEMGDIGSFHLNYEDRECKLALQLAGTLVREEDVDPDRRVFGGVIKQSNVDLNNYVMLKQKMGLMKKRAR